MPTPTPGSMLGNVRLTPGPCDNTYRGYRPPLWSLTVSRITKPSWCEDCPIPARGPKVRAAAARTTILLSAGGVADEWVTQLLRQGDAKMFKKYSQMKLQMKREALAKLNRKANEEGNSGTGEAA